jgi:hypothetical protein
MWEHTVVVCVDVIQLCAPRECGSGVANKRTAHPPSANRESA